MGFGNIGIHLAKRLRPFGVQILATKRSWALPLQNSLEVECMNLYNLNLLQPHDIFV